MVTEDKLPEQFKRRAYHPSAYIYAWRKNDLEKLLEELMQSNIAIKIAEAWLLEDEKILRLIPLRSGAIEVFRIENNPKKQEEWYDFVERSSKDTINEIRSWNLEKTSRLDKEYSIWYHFKLWEK